MKFGVNLLDLANPRATCETSRVVQSCYSTTGGLPGVGKYSPETSLERSFKNLIHTQDSCGNYANLGD